MCTQNCLSPSSFERRRGSKGLPTIYITFGGRKTNDLVWVSICVHTYVPYSSSVVGEEAMENHLLTQAEWWNPYFLHGVGKSRWRRQTRKSKMGRRRRKSPFWVVHKNGASGNGVSVYVRCPVNCRLRAPFSSSQKKFGKKDARFFATQTYL